MSDTPYEAHAKHLIDSFGVVEARRMTIRSREQNVVGSFSHAFHNAVLKFIEKLAKEAA